MELDELKRGWKTSVERMQKPFGDIQSLVNQQLSDPVTQLKNRFRKGMIIVPVVIAIALSRLPHHHSLTSNVLFCFLLVFALSMVGYFYYNYQMLARTQAMDITVKEHLQKQVRALEKGVGFRLLFTRGMAVLFIILIELLVYWKNEPSSWAAEPIMTRITVYTAAFAAFYLLTYLAVKHRYSKTISHLKKLVNELK